MKSVVLGLVALFAATSVQAEGQPITIRITFEPSVTKRLIAMGEWVTVSAFYFGDPARKDIPVDEMGQVYLGSEELRLYPVNQTIRLGGVLDGAPKEWTGEPRVNVNVFTSRFVDENNLINCGIVEDAVTVAAASDNLITCTWLGE